jgi:glycerol-3-phosphate dehydrogenase (NAD(P)+)
MATRIATLGDGAWGTAIACLLAAKADHRVSLWSARPQNAEILRQKRENPRYLPGVSIPESVHLTGDLNEAIAGSDLWIIAVPTVYLRATLLQHGKVLSGPMPVVSLAKGIEIDTFLRPSEIIIEVIGPRRLTVLSGPSHAEEVSRGLPATVVAASADFELARWVQQLFTTERFRVYTNFDVLGVELAGALKNVIGIAAGICDGLSLGDNAKSALVTRGLVEIARLGVALGAEHETFFGLAGLGDLITTCISRHGRNRFVGERLGKGQKLKDILASMEKVAEGVYTVKSVHERARQMGIDMPITTEVYRVCYEDKDARAAVSSLMMRDPRSEQKGP